MNTIYSPHNTRTHNHSPPKNHQEEKNIEMLEKLAKGTRDVLVRTKSVFPFDFFPDEITVDENKVNITFKEFFFSEDIHTILIHLIKDIEVETSVFFGTLKIVPDGYPAQPICVRYLKKSDALRIRRIVQGLMLSKKEGIDMSKIHNDDLCEKVEQIGHIQPRDK